MVRFDMDVDFFGCFQGRTGGAGCQGRRRCRGRRRGGEPGVAASGHASLQQRYLGGYVFKRASRGSARDLWRFGGVSWCYYTRKGIALVVEVRCSRRHYARKVESHIWKGVPIKAWYSWYCTVTLRKVWNEPWKCVSTLVCYSWCHHCPKCIFRATQVILVHVRRESCPRSSENWGRVRRFGAAINSCTCTMQWKRTRAACECCARAYDTSWRTIMEVSVHDRALQSIASILLFLLL